MRKLKKIAFSSMNKICSLCLAFGFFTHFKGISVAFFGEPKYPVPEDYE